jgi:endonuclease YncB( thermonuclease family)
MKKVLLFFIVAVGLIVSVAAEQCQAITQKGRQCRRNASPGSKYCWQHGGAAQSKVGDSVSGKKALVKKDAVAAKIDGRIVGVADGDTVTILDAAKVQHKIRLDRIDAPEKKQAFGEKAKQHLSEMVFGKDVRVEYTSKDRYGRILGIVRVDGRDINLQMIKDGFAWHYKYYDKTPAYANAEVEAREAKRGLWVDANPVAPYDFRKMGRKNGKVRK